eukprot:c15482_g1_i1 orf=365-805(+)
MFKRRMWLNKDTFQFLCAQLAPFMRCKDTNWRRALSVKKCICVALHRLATGPNLHVVVGLFGIATSSAQQLVNQFCEAVAETSGLRDDYVKWPSTKWMKILAEGFEAIQGLPYVIGAIDGSHVPIIAPNKHHEDYINRKGFHSVIL